MVVEVGDGHLRIALRAARRPAAPPTASRRRARRSRPPARRPARPSTSRHSPASQPIVPPRSGASSVAFARAAATAARRGRPCPTCGWAARRRAPAAAPARRAASRPAWRARRGQVERRVGARDVADQQRGAAGGPPHRGGAAADAGQVHQRRVDLAELDAPAADLDLVVGAAARRYRPSGSSRTRSPLRYARSQPSVGIGAYFSASFSGSR